MLHEFVAEHRETILGRCKTKEVARRPKGLACEEFDHGVPVFLDQLLDELRGGLPTPDGALAATAARHGVELLLHGFTIGQVVHGYGDVCQAITELAVELEAPISASDFHQLNRCLDD